MECSLLILVCRFVIFVVFVVVVLVGGLVIGVSGFLVFVGIDIEDMGVGMGLSVKSSVVWFFYCMDCSFVVIGIWLLLV